jgi:hypothetical protein
MTWFLAAKRSPLDPEGIVREVVGKQLLRPIDNEKFACRTQSIQETSGQARN